jgi:IS30 family transposase
VLNSAGEVLHYRPVTITPEKPRSCRYLSEQERVMIADLLAAGNTVRGIAGELGRSPSTISREIRRNAGTDGRYRPHQAQRAARERARRPRQRLLVLDAVLGDTVRGLLGQRWSPEQVGHELAVRFAGQRRRCLCTESI